MKKLLLIAATAVVAQTATAQISVAPEVGFQMTNVKEKTLGEKASNDMKAGLRAGINADFGITNNIHVSAGLFYSGMGTKATQSGEDMGIKYSYTATLSLDYVQVPVYINYMTGEAGSNRFFAGVGPYLGYALGGKIKVEDESQKVEFGNETGKMKRMDLGINVNAGYMLSMGIYARAFYSMGLVNYQGNGNSDNSLKNSSFGLTLGYNFSL
jgi:hypothetical protein